MGLNYARKQAAQKQIEANKARAHVKNHEQAYAEGDRMNAEHKKRDEADKAKDKPKDSKA